MKTKILLTVLALSFSVAGFAQEKTTLEKRITNYAIRIDSIVSAEQNKMNAELDDAEKKFKDGKISKADLKEERSKISQNFAAIINEKIDAEKEEMDLITKESATNSVMGNEDDSVIKKILNKKEKTPKELLKSGGLVFSLGYLNTTSNAGSLNFFSNSEYFKGSSSVSLTSASERQIGKYTSPVFINYGYGIRIDTYNLKNDQIFSQANDELNLSTFSGGNLKYSILRETYLEIPVNLSFVLNPKYKDFEGVRYLDATKKQLRVGLGLYGGVRIGNRIRYKYSNAESGKNIFVQKVENGVNPFIFGSKFSIGYNGINIFVKKDFSSVFNNSANISEKNALQIGIELATINF